jgi:CheY-like chemotaxis protein
LNNWLTVITGVSELALGRLGKKSALRADLEQIRQAAGRAGNLSRQLLNFARPSKGEVAAFDMATVLNEMRELIVKLMGERVRVSVHAPTGVARVRADRKQIEHVILNLVSNAGDAMPQGGSLTLSLEEQAVPPGSPMAIPEGIYAVLLVSDTGVGMDDSVRARLFEPFFTSKRPGKGTGLGLFVSYGIVKSYGGTVVAESRPNAGSTFRVYLPLSATLQGIQPLGVAPPSHRKATETILLVEDDAHVRRLLKAVLESRGYRIIEAEDGERGLARFIEARETVELVLTDVVMPKMTGSQLAAEIRKLRPGTRILFMSSYSDEAVEAQGVTADVPLLRKPFSVDLLLESVRKTLDE